MRFPNGQKRYFLLVFIGFLSLIACTSTPSGSSGGGSAGSSGQSSSSTGFAYPDTNGDTYSPPVGYSNLVWSDEFNGSQIDLANWSYNTGAGGWGNNELENYTDNGTGGQNAYTTNGYLVIKAINQGGYTSARMLTLGKQSWKHGVVVARMRLPYGKGIWPAFWMMGTNINDSGNGWPKCGEIDIMEMVGGGTSGNNTTYGTLHWGEIGAHQMSPSTSYVNVSSLSADWHYYELIWTASTATIRFDGNTVATVTISDKGCCGVITTTML